MFFNSTPTDRRRHTAQDMADYWQSFLSDGVIHRDGTPELRVRANGTMGVSVDAGRAIIKGHLYLNTTTVKLPIRKQQSGRRYDRIVLRYDNSINNRFIKLFVVEGTSSRPPSPTRSGDVYELALATVEVTGGAIQIHPDKITDERLDESVCGIASSLVTVPTSSFEERWNFLEREYLKWFENTKDATFATQRDVHQRYANAMKEISFLMLKQKANDRIKNGKSFASDFAGNSYGIELLKGRATITTPLRAGTRVIPTKEWFLLQGFATFDGKAYATLFDGKNSERVAFNLKSGTLDQPLKNSYNAGCQVAETQAIEDRGSRALLGGSWGDLRYEEYNGERVSVTAEEVLHVGQVGEYYFKMERLKAGAIQLSKRHYTDPAGDYTYVDSFVDEGDYTRTALEKVDGELIFVVSESTDNLTFYVCRVDGSHKKHTHTYPSGTTHNRSLSQGNLAFLDNHGDFFILARRSSGNVNALTLVRVTAEGDRVLVDGIVGSNSVGTSVPSVVHKANQIYYVVAETAGSRYERVYAGTLDEDTGRWETIARHNYRTDTVNNYVGMIPHERRGMWVVTGLTADRASVSLIDGSDIDTRLIEIDAGYAGSWVYNTHRANGKLYASPNDSRNDNGTWVLESSTGELKTLDDSRYSTQPILYSNRHVANDISIQSDLSSNTHRVYGSGQVGEGVKLTSNDIRFRLPSPSSDIAMYLEHTEDTEITGEFDGKAMQKGYIAGESKPIVSAAAAGRGGAEYVFPLGQTISGAHAWRITIKHKRGDYMWLPSVQNTETGAFVRLADRFMTEREEVLEVSFEVDAIDEIDHFVINVSSLGEHEMHVEVVSLAGGSTEDETQLTSTAVIPRDIVTINATGDDVRISQLLGGRM